MKLKEVEEKEKSFHRVRVAVLRGCTAVANALRLFTIFPFPFLSSLPGFKHMSPSTFYCWIKNASVIAANLDSTFVRDAKWEKTHKSHHVWHILFPMIITWLVFRITVNDLLWSSTINTGNIRMILAFSCLGGSYLRTHQLRLLRLRIHANVGSIISLLAVNFCYYF